MTYEDDDFIEFDIDDDFNGVDDVMIIAVAADPETYLPRIVLGIPIDEDDEFQIEGIAPLTLSPEEAYQVGAYLIQAASTVSSFYTELIDKTLEERKEILDLESQFLNSSFTL
jgi:hypothetical protein